MKPSCFLEPDAEKMQLFFRSFSLPSEYIDDLEAVSIKKIWIDEAENSWELEYSSVKPVDAEFLDG